MTRILVVEDSSTQAAQLRLLLEHEGYAVEVAPDAQRGFDLFRSVPFDLVMTDILMPGPSGFELCGQIKADPGGKQVPVLLLTTLNDPRDILRGMECGADDFVTKPFQADALLARIRGLFDS